MQNLDFEVKALYRRIDQPERDLVCALLKRTYYDLRGGGVGESRRDKYQTMQEARQWVLEESEDPLYDTWSFDWCCLAVDLESEVVRNFFLKDAPLVPQIVKSYSTCKKWVQLKLF